jgi:hypothetical protein
MYKFTDSSCVTQKGFQYFLPQNGKPSDWVEAPDPAKRDGNSCGVGRLHLMLNVWPIYAPANYRCFEAEGKELVGGDKEKKAYHKVRLLRELSPTEIDQGIDDVFTEKLGKPNIFLPIAWARTAKFLDRPIGEAWLSDNLLPIMKLLSKQGIVKVYRDSLGASLRDSLRDSLGASLRDSLRASLWASLWDSLRASLRASLRDSLWASLGDSLRDSLGDSLWASLRDSLGDSLRDSLWASLFYERGFALCNKPIPELTGLLDVWRAGACPVGFDRDDNMLVLTK